MPRSHGPRRKSRHILKKNIPSKGVSFLLRDYEIGDKVVIDIDPREHNTIPHRRYQGRVGVIQGIGKRTIKVGIAISHKQKILQTKFNHVRPFLSDHGDKDGN
jgi:large subunit ribosomal protein L21e